MKDHILSNRLLEILSQGMAKESEIQQLSGPEIRVLLLLYTEATRGGWPVTISIGEIAERLGYGSVNPIRDAITSLKQRRIVATSGNQGRPLRYFIAVPSELAPAKKQIGRLRRTRRLKLRNEKRGNL